jgi:uncharacterized protein
MQFLLTAYDGTDEKALERRMAAREAHLAVADGQKARGEMLFGGAILDDAGKMIGSAVVYNFPDRVAMDAAIAADPYVTGKVWQNITIHPYRLAPMFTK